MTQILFDGIKNEIRLWFADHINNSVIRMNIVDIKDACARLSTYQIEQELFTRLTSNNRIRRRNAKDKAEIMKIYQEEEQLKKDLTELSKEVKADLIKENYKI